MTRRRELRSVDDVILNILDDINRPVRMERWMIKTIFYTQVNNYLRPDQEDNPTEVIHNEIKRVLESQGYKYQVHGERWYYERNSKNLLRK